MLWFKHITNTTSDPDLMNAVSKFGSDAYYVFFVTLEILTKEEAFNKPLDINFKVFKWRFPHISGPKLKKILQFFNECRGNAEEMPRISAVFKQEMLSVFSDKLSILSRSYRKKLGNNLEKTSTYRREKKEERRKNTPISPERGDDVFETFWKSYPKKVGKGAAFKSWKRIQKPVETLNLILKALKWQKNTDQWTKENGQYIPNPATYLNQTRWEDENKESKQETGLHKDGVYLL